MKQILVISSAESTENVAVNEQFIDELNTRAAGEFNCTSIHYDDIAFEFGKKARAFSLVSGADITTYDYVYFKSFIRYEERAFALATVLRMHKVPFVCSEVVYGLSTSKLSQYALLASANIPLPKTLYIPLKRLHDSYDTFAAALLTPFIFKAADGKGGEANFLIKDRDQYTMALLQHVDKEFVGQTFITNSGDLRVLVVNNKIRLVIGRARKDDTTHLNNTSQGADARLLPLEELTNEAQELSLKAASAVNREIAGVDIMFEQQTNKPYILEVNGSPQVGSGAFTEEKLQVYKDFFTEALQNSNKNDIIGN